MRSSLLALLLCLITTTARSDDRPNIILIVVEDLGRDWVSCYGAKHQTPNIDRLARQGVRYETAWSTPTCTPTRVTLLTGQYPFRNGWTQHYDVPRWGGDGLSWKKFTTFARVLRDAGYATAVGGKWQINHLGDQPNALQRHGFDEHCVWTGDEAERMQAEAGEWNGQLMTNGHRDTVSSGPEMINSFLCDFIRRSHKKPFLVHYPMLLTQAPHLATSQNRANAAKAKAALYADNVTYMDRLVGKLLNSVDEAGLAKNTLIVFTADNGSAVGGHLNGNSLEKGKGREADLGAHVPFVVRAPFLTQGGRVSRDLIDFTDLYPTFVELAKTTSPEGVKVDGRSFAPSLRGSEDPFEKRSWVFSQLGDFRMVRDWQHILDSSGNFHDLTKDPLQQREVSRLDKIAPGRRQRLEMILERFPKDGPAPFPEYAARYRLLKQER